MTTPELAAAFAMAEELASKQRYESRATLFRAVNEALGLDWTDAAWRGHMNRNVDVREKINSLIVPQAAEPIYRIDGRKEIRLTGDMRGSVSSDEHVPFHDPRAIALMCDILHWWKPDVHIYNGDQTDWYQLSDFDKNPERETGIQQDADQAKEELYAPVRRATRKTQFYKVDGNHCFRLWRYLWARRELRGLRALQPENLFEFDKFGITHAGLRVRIDNVLEISHGTRVNKWAGMSAKAELEERRYGISTITGHVHRAGRSETRTIDGGYVMGHENPCLCQLQPEYKADPDWVQGISLFEIKGGRLWVETVLFNSDYSACAAGKWFGI